MPCIDHGTGVSSLCCGTLRKMECDLIEKKEVVAKDEHVDAMFDHPTKRLLKGLMCKIPRWVKGSL